MQTFSGPAVPVKGGVRRRVIARTVAGSVVALALPLTLSFAQAAQQQTSASTAAQPSSQLLTVDRIFTSGEFRLSPVPQPHWLKNGTSYVDLRNVNGGVEIVRVDARSGVATILAPASIVKLPDGSVLPIEDIELSADEKKALIFHNSERVWRQNTKGQYTVIDFAAQRAIPVAPNAGAKMFAKFSPDGHSVAYVRDNNLYTFDLATGTERQLTQDGSENIINGTSDWVYEEEFDLRDGFRWSPDGKHIAFWRFDQSAVPLMTLMDDTDSLYPKLFQYKYPKAGQPNSTVKIGVVNVASGATTWMNLGSDSTVYIPRMGWVGSDSLWIERMPRKQNRADLLMASIANGGTRHVMTDVDSAYVDVVDVIWINNYKQFLWKSDRSGWRQVYLYNRNGSVARQLTKDGFDVLDIAGVDTVRKGIYVKAAAPNPTQAQIYFYSFDGKKNERVTKTAGSYNFDLAPGGKYASAIFSSISSPPSSTIYELPSMRVVRVLGNNDALKQKVAALGIKTEFIKIPAADNSLWLDAYRILPPGFDSTKKYPVMMYAYGGPAVPQVLDMWMGSRYLFHAMLAQQGYVVVVADNRGAAWRGTQFRKMTQYKLGIIESDDQIAVAKWIGRQSWGDSSRIGMWGWSYGGYNTAMSVFRGGDTFKLGISVAPVCDWRYYDSIYTERFMWIPQENAEGYKSSSVLSYINNLRSKYLLIHGLADDNVHPQNATVLAKGLEYARKPFSLMFYPTKNHSISGPGGTLPLFDLLERYIRENL
jgi:dipeptidyl-peptidase-4